MNQPDQIHRFESMLFKNETTLKTDFNNGEIKPKLETVYREKPCCLRKRPPPLKDLQSLTDWKVPNVPFNLFIKPHDIHHKNPWVVQEAYYEPPDEQERENVQKTRPRVIMAPFVSMDDFKGPEDQQRLKQSFYTTDAMRFGRKMQEVTSHSYRAPHPTGLPAPANPIYLPKLKAPYVSPEWRMDSVSWDNKQFRGLCDATKEFWLRRPISKCRMCEETAIVHDHRQSMDLMQSRRRGGRQ